MQALHSVAQMQAWSRQARADGHTIGLVPTMGYLHPGHASLMARLRPQVDRLVVSIYVNPLQFAPHEDFDTYPRDEQRDLAICREQGVDAVFFPPPAGDPAGLYPPGFETRIQVPALDRGLCATSRPHFFTGVATVVYRLLRVVGCDRAVFGEKDYQQLAIIRRMVRDLDLGVEIDGAPLVREPDGLAMSSRNVYLSPADRERAVSLSRALGLMQAAVASGSLEVQPLLELGRGALDVDEIDYLEVVDKDSLEPLERIRGEARVAVAAVLGKTRLIDNRALVPGALGDAA